MHLLTAVANVAAGAAILLVLRAGSSPASTDSVTD